MNYDIFDFLVLLGSLGIFLYGMKLMSEALQKVAGNRLRNFLSAMTSNKFKGVFTGLAITSIIQSSSATTVMVVSFVNAGLLSLTQSISVIMGANVGTTITAWLISILGFKVSMTHISLIMIGLSLPLLFSQKAVRKNYAELFIGFAMLFIGLDFLMKAMPDIKENVAIFNFLQNYADMGYWSYLLFLFIGVVLTIVIQSSSATMALTLVMCANGWIGFEVAAAMVLGENIGTTITANLAAIVANANAKRAALAHTFFNLFGVMWVFALFPFFTSFIAHICIYFGMGDPMTSAAAMPVGLSLFHTIFNVSNVIILVWFTDFIAKTVVKIIPQKEKKDEKFTLKYIKAGLLSTPEASIFQVKKEISLYAENTKDMFQKVKDAYNMPLKNFEKELNTIIKMEDDNDQMELVIGNYLSRLTETKLSRENATIVKSMYKIISEIESIADSSLVLAKTIARRNDQKICLPESIDGNISKMFNMLGISLDIMCENLAKEFEDVMIQKAMLQERSINEFRDKIKIEHIENINRKLYDYNIGVLYTDFYENLEQVGDYVINVSESLVEIKN